MQQGLPTGDVFKPSVSARVGSLDVDVSSVQVDRELPDPLAGGSLSAATATITGTVGDDVSGFVPTPWDPGAVWPPAPEAPATVSLNAGPGAVQSLTGRVQSASGGTSGREVSVEIADLYQTLERTISWDALADQMPSPIEAASTRFIGLHSLAVTDQMFRHCGWFATPPAVAYSVLSVPAMGTMWPETGYGTLLTSTTYANPGGGVYPIFYSTPWGLGTSYVDARYQLRLNYSLAQMKHMEMSAMVAQIAGRTDMSLAAEQGNAARARLRWTQNFIYLDLWNGTSLSTAVNVARTTGLCLAEIDYVSSTSVSVRLQNSAGTVSTATVTVAAAVTGTEFTTGRIQGDHLGSGFQIAFPQGAAGALRTWKPNAVIHRGPTAHNIKVRPPVVGENVADLLNQQCVAENATYWIDEQGVMQWWHLTALDAQSNSATLTAADNIGEGGFTWSHDMSQVKSRVVVKWKDWAYTGSIVSSIDLWQDSGTTLEPGQVVQEFVEMPDNEVWVQPNLNFQRIGDQGPLIADFNKGRGSWWGGVLQDVDTWAQEQASLAFAMSQVNGKTFKYTLNWAGSSSAEMKTVSIKNVTSGVGENKRSYDLPILRGKGKFTLADAEYTAAKTGPASAQEHVIDAGWWIQEVEQAQAVADYAAARLTVPQPVLSSVDVILAPGIQLGDILTVTDGAVSRLTVRGVVAADSRSIDDDMGVSHSITIRPLSVSRNGVTWQEWGDFMKSALWQSWGAAHSGTTWQSWGSNPLA